MNFRIRRREWKFLTRHILCGSARTALAGLWMIGYIAASIIRMLSLTTEFRTSAVKPNGRHPLLRNSLEIAVQDVHELKLLAGQILDGACAPIANGVVVVKGDVIHWVGRLDALPAEYRSGDGLWLGGEGFTVMPGLVDGHIHISFGEARAEEEVALYSPVEYRTLKAAWFARKVLRAGVTSAFDAATTFNVAVSVRDAIEAGMIEGPRMAVCGRQITTIRD
jgi:hypothetical protein